MVHPYFHLREYAPCEMAEGVKDLSLVIDLLTQHLMVVSPTVNQFRRILENIH